MTFRITYNSGNGELGSTAISSYAYSEEVTSLEPGETSGGTGQVTLTGVEVEADKVGSTHPNSKLLINNTMRLEDSDHGEVEFQVKQVQVANGLASITGDTIQARLNVDKTAPAIFNNGSSGATLKTAFDTYCGLVGITPIYDGTLATELEEIPVNFMGWVGNVWEYLKMLTTASSVSLTDRVSIEMYVAVDGLHFRKALQEEIDFVSNKNASSLSVNVDSFDASKEVDVYNYNTSYGQNRVIFEEKNYSETGYTTNSFKASIDDSLQVEIGETLVKRFKIDATLTNINQPSPVSTISQLPYVGGTGEDGEYVIVGSDNLPIQPAQWTAEGGSLRVRLTEVPNEIEIEITAPNVPDGLPQVADPNVFGFGPYKIGVESSGNTDYPALWLTGTGVFFNKRLKKFSTGASDQITSRDAAASVDNIFITNDRIAASAGLSAAQLACGPKLTLAADIPDYGQFGSSIGAVQYAYSNKFRIESVSYSPSNTSVSAFAKPSFADFNAEWTGKTFANFNATALTDEVNGLRFNEFTVIPLMESV